MMGFSCRVLGNDHKNLSNHRGIMARKGFASQIGPLTGRGVALIMYAQAPCTARSRADVTPPRLGFKP